MARKFMTIFHSKRQTRLILPLFAGLKSPLYYHKNFPKKNSKGKLVYPMSWYQIVEPNLESFDPTRKSKQPYRNSIDAKTFKKKGDVYQFIYFDRKVEKGLNEYVINKTDLIRYIASIIDATLPQTPANAKDIKGDVSRSFDKFQKYYRIDKDNLEYWDKVRNRLFSKVESSYMQVLMSVHVSKLRNILKGKNLEIIALIFPVFEKYCQELIARDLVEQSFDNVIRDFLFGIAMFPKPISITAAKDLTDQQEEQYLTMSKFMQLCELYKLLVDRRKEDDKLKPTETQEIAIRCLVKEAMTPKSPLRLVVI